MADSSVLLEVRVEGKNIQVVQRQVEELASSVNKASQVQNDAAKMGDEAQKTNNKNARQTYNNQRSIINGSLAQGRANAKLASGITSGLVPAYAEIVSNIFAVQQAFSVLRRAQALDILIDNLERTGAAAGRNLPVLAENLREVTDGALSTREALESVANATAQGFSGAQLEQLTKVAKGASSALGRDLSDSLDRLVRGTAKLEPEILDELGIIVRLDDATREYAATIGKSVNDLTQFERQQAFLNATLEQGNKKFGETAESTETNPYSKLSATFDDLAQSILSFVNVALVPIAEFFSQSKLALTGALLFFVQTISNRLTPTLAVLRENATAALSEMADLASQAGASLQKDIVDSTDAIANSTAKLPKGFKELKPAILDGSASVEDLESAISSLERSENSRSKNLEKAGVKDRTRKTEELAAITELKTQVEGLLAAKQAVQGSEIALINIQAAQESESALSNTLEELESAEGPIAIFKIAMMGAGEQLKIMGRALKDIGKAFITFSKDVFKGKFSLDAFRLSAALAGITLRGLKNAVIALGKGFLALIPYIGPILIIFDLLRMAYNWLFPESETEKKVNDVVSGFSQIQDSSMELQKTLDNAELPSYEKNIKELEIVAGLLDQLSSGLQSAAAADQGVKDAVKDYQDIQGALSRTKSDLQAVGLAETGFGRFLIKIDKNRVAYAKRLLDAKRQEATLSADNAKEIVDGFTAQIYASEALTKAFADRLEVIEELKAAAVESQDPEDVRALLSATQNLSRETSSQVASLKALGESYANVRKEAFELGKQEDTRFSKQIGNFQSLANNLANLEKIDGANLAEFLSEDQLNETLAILKQMDALVGDVSDKGYRSVAQRIKDGVAAAKELENNIRRASAESKELAAQAKQLGKISKESSILTSASIDLQNAAIQKVIDSKEDELRLINLTQGVAVTLAEDELARAKAAFDRQQNEENALRLSNAELAVAEKRAALERSTAELASETRALEASKVDAAEKTFEVEKARIAGAQKLLEFSKKQLTVVETLNKQSLAATKAQVDLNRGLTGSDVNVQDQLGLALEENRILNDGQAERIRIQKNAIKLEYDLIRAKTAFEKSRLDNLIDQELAKPREDRNLKYVASLRRARVALVDITIFTNKAEEAANDLVGTTERHNKALRESNIKLLREQVRRAKIQALQDKQVALAERYGLLLVESVAPLVTAQATAERVKQIQTDLNTLKATNNEEDANGLAISLKELELIGAQNEELTAQLELREQLLDNSKEFVGNLINALKESSAIRNEIATISNTNPFTGQIKSVQEASEIAAKERQERLRLAEMEATLKQEQMKAEFALLKAKQQLLIQELAKDGLTAEERQVIEASNRVIAQQATVNAIVSQNIDDQKELLRDQIEAEERKNRGAIFEAAGGGLAGVAAIFRDAQANRNAEAEGTPELDKTLTAAKQAGEAVAAELSEALETASKQTQTAASTAATQLAESVTKIPAAVVEGTKQSLTQALKEITVNTIKSQNLLVATVPTTANMDEIDPPAPASADTGSTAADTANETAVTPPPTATTAETVTVPAVTESTTPMLEETPGISTPDVSAPDDSSKILTTAEAWALAKDSAASYAAQLSQFGPEGAAMGAFLQGGLNFAESIENSMAAFEKADDAAGKSQAILQGVGGAIAAIGQMQQAAAAQKVAAIDNEIAAEKARDGKSKESLAKIKALEAKKLATQRKAFEQNKKIQLAQAIVNGMSAIQSGFATQPFFPVGILMGAMAVAMTAMQIKAIQSQTFNGGGGASTPSGPTSISLGERKTSSDLAKSQSSAGELAYMRGADGVGGPENFKPAMMGAKYRATGGPTTGYVVGEQGPELFVPDTPGTIVPNNSEPQMQQPTNVNFSINTIDASGVEEVLTAQSGNIIGMIRSAANSYGQNFLEEVDVGSYTQSATGATRY